MRLGQCQNRQHPRRIAETAPRPAKAAIHEICQAETRRDAEAGIDQFARIYGDKYPKAGAKLVKDRDVLLTFYDFPAAHWVHLRGHEPHQVDLLEP